MRRPKLLLAAICIAAVLATLISQNTLAFYTVIGRATNVVTSGNIQLKIHETTENGDPFPTDGVFIMPGQVVGKRVTVENQCQHPFWLRVKIIYGIEGEQLPYEDLLQVDINTAHWTVMPDGYIYYNQILEPGLHSEPVFTEVTVAGEKLDLSYIHSTLTLTVDAYAVQSENNPAAAPWEAAGWPADN